MLCFKRWCFKDTKFKGKCQMTDLKCSDVLTRETFFWGGAIQENMNVEKRGTVTLLANFTRWVIRQQQEGDVWDSTLVTHLCCRADGRTVTYDWIFSSDICSQHTRTCQTGFTRSKAVSMCVFQATSGLLRVVFAETLSPSLSIDNGVPQSFLTRDLWPLPPPYVCCVSSCQGFRQWD